MNIGMIAGARRRTPAVPVVPLTWVPAKSFAGTTFSNDDRTATCGAFGGAVGTAMGSIAIPVTGKWAFEITIPGGGWTVGLTQEPWDYFTARGDDDNSVDIGHTSYRKFNGVSAGSGPSNGATRTHTILVDRDTNTLWCLEDGVAMFGDPVAGTGGLDVTGLFDSPAYPFFRNWFNSAGDAVIEGVDLAYPVTGFTPLAQLPPSSSQRLAAALAHPTPRQVATTDPITVTEYAHDAVFPETQLVPVLDNPLVHSVYGKAVYSFGTAGNEVITIQQVHADGVTPGDEVNGLSGLKVKTPGRYIMFFPAAIGQKLYIFVDGVLTSEAGYTTTNTGGYYNGYRLDLGSYTPTGRTVLFCSAGRHGYAPLRIESGYDLLDPAPRWPFNIFALADSFGEPTGSTAVNNFLLHFAERLGGTFILPSGLGSTGFARSVFGRVNYADRIAAEISLKPVHDPQFDLTAIFASGNDLKVNFPAMTQGEWEAFYIDRVNATISTAVALSNPTAPVAVFDFQNKENLGMTDLAFMRGAIAEACTAHGALWVPGMPERLAALDATTRNSFYDETGHPTDTGSKWIGPNQAELFIETYA